MIKRLRKRILLAVTMVGGLSAPPVLAEVKDYQIRRLIILCSTCNLDANSIKRTVRKNNSLHFHGICKNLSFYPDGIVVECEDNETDLSCKIKTEAKKFDKLNLLRDSVNQDPEAE